MRSTAFAAALVLLTATAAPLAVPVAGAEGAPTVGEQARAAIRAWASEHGADADLLLAQTITLAMPGADGEVELTIDQFLDRLDGAAVQGGGAAGLPLVTAGDILHVYVNLRFFGSALAYDVHTSRTIPSTPPVVLPPPATPLFFDVGGPARNVEGSYLFGAHTAGTLVGSNADTSGNLPLLSSALVTDRAISFGGHALVAQGEACIFGIICIAAGLMLATGVAGWDGGFDVPRLP
jgi:hypothetical protein